MSRLLMIDIGAGTLDLLCYDSQGGEHFKAVVPAPVRHLAEQIGRTTGALLVVGGEMGGGPVTEALQERARTAEVIMSPTAAATLHHDPQRVRDWGIAIADDQHIARLSADSRYTTVRLGDIQPERISRIVEGIGWPMAFDAVAICAQDHGVAPQGVSHLDFRHRLFEEMLNRDPTPHQLLFHRDAVPAAFNRLRSIAADAVRLNARDIYVMDSGMAAMAGAAQDLQARDLSPVIILDVATSHTVIAALTGDQVAGFVEYHTRDITLERLETLIVALADGRLRHDQVLAEGGHGAYLRQAVGYTNVRAIIVTGPKRRLMAGTRLPVHWGSPWGDNMMTGTVGLLESLRRRIGIPPISFL
ncbi:MAG: pyruvate formate-lyase activating enzyme [Desulfatitalea sp. BRH_c12]|nr:MAG: pyruvate formate-lyase activating enzyme [Desulfatitalea sp. BRH_c12]